MPHDNIECLDSVHWYLLTAALQSFLQCIEADLSHELDGNTEHPVSTFTWQRYFQLNLPTDHVISVNNELI